MSSFLFIICQLKVSQGDVAIMFGLCQVYPSHVRVCRGLSGLQGSIQVCQTPPSGSVKVHQGFSGSVNVCYGLSGFVLVRSGSCKGSVKTVKLFSSSLRLKQGFQSCLSWNFEKLSYCRAVQRSEFLGGPSLTDLQNTGGARLGASIDFLKNWGGRGPPGPPGWYGPAYKERLFEGS